MSTIHHFNADATLLEMSGRDTVSEALQAMDAFNRQAVGIVDRDVFLGVFTYDDFFHRIVKKNMDPRKTFLMDVMTIAPQHRRAHASA